MAKDPAFLFYPGDYLRDTQNFTEGQQVAYDRIMCEHMRNICITQTQLNFFTKRISSAEKAELMFYLKRVNGGYQIEWVAESIIKRRAYTESRRNNKRKKDKSVCSTYDNHMENENENENRNEISGIGGVGERVDRTNYLKVLEKLKSDELFVESLMRTGKCEKSALNQLYDDFFSLHLGQQKEWVDEKDLRVHLVNYARKVVSVKGLELIKEQGPKFLKHDDDE